MKKGDLRKQEILSAAEALFCRKGYTETSVQDILDLLNASKGSFYHHFTSKEALLEGICRKRAEQIRAAAGREVSDDRSAAQNLDALLTGMIPFRGEKLSFLMMLLPVFILPEGRMVKTCYCEALADQFLDGVSEQLKRGAQEGELICADPAITAELLLSLVNSLWVRICDMIIGSEESQSDSDLSEYLMMTDCYRESIERILTLPYGSLTLADIPSLGYLRAQIHSHWKTCTNAST